MDDAQPEKSEISPQKLEANRRNSKKSTGPKTVGGKRNSSRNALKHGLLSQDIILPGEDALEFDVLLSDLIRDRQPEGRTEETLVERIAVCDWRLLRALRAEVDEVIGDSANEQMFPVPAVSRPKNLPGIAATNKILRYETTIHRQKMQTMQLLQSLQQRRKSLKVPVSEAGDSPKT